MNADRLISARAARWSQNGEARLTLESAREWLDSIGFCLDLPGPASAAPMASFVEAVVGRPAPAPSSGERSRAGSLLARIVADNAAVPLKLGAAVGEQPDFVVAPQVLRYVYALRGNRNFKNGPTTGGNEKTTPLALHCWQTIQEHGPLDVPALQQRLGQDITEAAILRALHELWTGLYVLPIPGTTGEPPKWELLADRFSGQVAAGAVTSHAEALSALISLYLQAMVAATEEEIVTFLSPFAPQSRLREIIRGLGSMRQLDIIDIGGRSHVCLQGGLLPEEVQAPPVPEQEETPAFTVERVEDAPPEPRTALSDRREASPRLRPRPDKFTPGKFSPKKFAPGKFAPRKPSSGRPFAASAAERPPRRFDGKRAAGRPLEDRGGGQRPGRFPQKPSGQWSKPWKRPGVDDTSTPADAPRPRSSGPAPWKPTGAPARKGGFSARPQKPWQQRSFQRSSRPGAESGASPERPAGSRAGTQKYGSKPGTKPWAKKSGPRTANDAASSRDKPWRSKSSGPQAGSARDGWKGKPRPGGGSFQRPPAADSEPRSNRPSRFKPGDTKRPPAGAKPRSHAAKRAPGAQTATAGGAKPFWAKNPRNVKKNGGKGAGKGRHGK